MNMAEGYIVNYEDFGRMINNYMTEFGSAKDPLTAVLMMFWRWNEVNIFGLSGPGQYEDLSERYQAWKESVVGFVYPVLKLWGVLEQSITGPDSIYSVAEIHDNYLVMGTNATTHDGTPYAYFLQVGTKNMPERPFIIKTEEQMNMYARTFMETAKRKYDNIKRSK